MIFSAVGLTTRVLRPDRELGALGLPATAITTALDMIASLRDLPAGKLADALADTVRGLDEEMPADLAATVGCLERLAASRPLNWQFDPALVRGMGYYTGQVFEITTPGTASSVAGGGRYDKLIGRWLGRDVPACGFSTSRAPILGSTGNRTTCSRVNLARGNLSLLLPVPRIPERLHGMMEALINIC